MKKPLKTPKAIDVHSLDEGKLKSLIKNHRDAGATDRLIYAEALAELERREGRGLDFDRSMSLIRAAAAEGRFLSYKELADESGADWGKVHYAVGGHLWRLVEYAHRKGWPMLSAIVVNKPNVTTGEMAPETLAGFMAAARALSHAVLDERKFLREQQIAVFRWAGFDPSGLFADAAPG